MTAVAEASAAFLPRSRRGLGRIGSVIRFLRRWPVISSTVLSVLVVAAIFAPFIAPYDPMEHDLKKRNTPPAFVSGGTWKHPLGTDILGRDLLSRMIFGARVSLTIASVGLAAGIFIGTTLGLWAGWFGGIVDEVITRAVDIWAGIPFIMLALAIAVVLGTSLTTITILLVLVSWTSAIRQVRAQVFILREREYVASARISGASTARLLFVHMLPGVLHLVVVVATFRIGGLILTESFLSFLGAGIPPPTPSWGNMVADGRNYLRTAWWLAVFPGVAIFMVSASLVFLGDWLRDYTDPRLRQLAG